MKIKLGESSFVYNWLPRIQRTPFPFLQAGDRGAHFLFLPAILSLFSIILLSDRLKTFSLLKRKMKIQNVRHVVSELL